MPSQVEVGSSRYHSQASELPYSTKTRSQARNIGLDLLRSIAVLLVLISHYANNVSFWLNYKPPESVFFTGDLGVDLFFGLSGFLIGRILLGIINSNPSWKNLVIFLVRRWMRTLPVYWLWLLIITILYPPAAHVGRMVLHFATMTQNLAQPMSSDFWYAVSWSLTIEEWFYILAGVSMIAATKVAGPRFGFWIPLVFLLAVPLWLRLIVPDYADRSTGLVKMVPFRLDEIGYGMILAWLHRRGHWIIKRPGLPLVVGLFCIAVVWLDLMPFSFQINRALRVNVTIIGCVLCIPAALRLYRLPYLLAALAGAMSRWSYSIYLVHLTVLVDLAQGLWWFHRISTTTAIVLAVTLPFIIAEILSRFVEQPIMRLRPRQEPPGA